MPGGLTVELNGPDGQKYAAAVAANLGRIPQQALPVMWDMIVRWFGEVVMQQQFDAEGNYLPGGPWKAISSDYQARKVAQGFFGQIGRRTGLMGEAFTNFHGEHGFAQVVDGGMGVTFGAEVFSDYGDEYSKYFNEVRKLFGGGDKLPDDAEFQMGKIMAMVYVLAMRVAAHGGPDDTVVRFDREVTSSYLSEFPAAPIDAYIDDLIAEVAPMMEQLG